MILSAAACSAFVALSAAYAVNIPTRENFNADVANWADNSGLALLDHVAIGGPDGSGYASTDFVFQGAGGAGGTSVVLFRGQDEFHSSADAFFGDWVDDKITKLTLEVRHSAPQPLSFFGRFSAPANFPGATAVQFVPVEPNVWTTLTFNIVPSNPQFVTFEGSDFDTVFSNLGHIQIGVSIPAALADDTATYSFGLDNVVAVPEASGFCLAALGFVTFGVRRSRVC
jgi:hypothetical protein